MNCHNCAYENDGFTIACSRCGKKSDPADNINFNESQVPGAYRNVMGDWTLPQGFIGQYKPRKTRIRRRKRMLELKNESREKSRKKYLEEQKKWGDKILKIVLKASENDFKIDDSYVDDENNHVIFVSKECFNSNNPNSRKMLYEDAVKGITFLIMGFKINNDEYEWRKKSNRNK